MDYLKRSAEDSMLQVGMLLSAVVATISWCISSSGNSMISTYIVCVLPVLLITVPDWTYFKRAPSEWTDVVFVEPSVGSTQVRRLALERDMGSLANNSVPRRRSSNSGPFR